MDCVSEVSTGEMGGEEKPESRQKKQYRLSHQKANITGLFGSGRLRFIEKFKCDPLKCYKVLSFCLHVWVKIK